MAEMFCKPALEFLAKEIKTWDGTEVLAEKVEKSIETTTAKLYEVYGKTDKPAYKVLNHGDFHFKNILYRNDSTKDEDLILIDFQFPLWNTPAIDIFYLLNMIASTETREEYREEIIQYYYKEFVKTLKDIGYLDKIPSFLNLQIELLRCGILDYMQNVASVPFHFLDWSKIDFAKLMEKDALQEGFIGIYKKVYAMQDFREYLIKKLNIMVSKGILE